MNIILATLGHRKPIAEVKFSFQFVHIPVDGSSVDA